MGIEGPHNSPEGAPDTGILATEPLPPGVDDISQIVDSIDERIRDIGLEDVEQADEAADEQDASPEGDATDQDSEEQPTQEPTG